MSEKAFGIDLGTTFSCIATYDPQYEKTEVLKNKEGKSTTPSVIYVESDRAVVVGEQAVNQQRGPNAKKTVSFAKRTLADDEACTDEALKRGDFGYPISAGKPLTPITVSAHILVKLATENPAVQNIVGGSRPKVVITFPAYFSASAKERTRQAGFAAGLDVIGMIEEPIAAALSYGFNRNAKNKTVMVYDLGGGTFDVTIVKFDADGNGFVVAKDGDPLLGGVDWDNAFGFYIWQKYNQICPQKIQLIKDDFTAQRLDDIDKLRKVNAFRRFAQDAKHALTGQDSYDVECDTDGNVINVTITEFNDQTKSRLQDTFDMVENVLEQCNSDDISDVLLVGGSSFMRQVKMGLEEKFPAFRGKMHLEEPHEAVAKGAAIYASIIMECPPPPLKPGERPPEPIGPGLIENISSRSYGVETTDTSTNTLYVSNIILKDDPLPAEHAKVYCTLVNDQTSMNVEVYESNVKQQRISLEEGKKITKGEYAVRFERPVPKGTEVEVSFRLDNAGLLSVYAKSLVDSGSVSFALHLEGTLDSYGMQEAQRQIGGVAKR